MVGHDLADPWKQGDKQEHIRGWAGSDRQGAHQPRQAVVGYVRLYRGGRTYSHGSGNACRDYSHPVRSGYGTYWQVNFSGSSFSYDFSGLYRGHRYCVHLVNYRGPGREYQHAWMTPVVDYARLTNVRLDAINPDYPQLRAQVNTSFAAPIDMYLYKGGALSNGRCVNGQEVFRQRYGASSSFTRTFTNTNAWPRIARHTNYCLQAVTRDGGNRVAGHMVRSSRGTPHSLTGSINQEAASFTVRARWRRYAAADANLSLYRNGNCTGGPIKVVPIAWNRQSSLDYTFTPGNTSGIQRGYQYCARLALGQDVRTTNLGTLFNPEIQWMRASVNQYSGRINVTADWTYSSAYTVHLYRGGSPANGGCNNTQGLQASSSFPSEGSMNRTWSVARGYHYCIILRLNTGGDRRSLRTEFVLHYPQITFFQGTGNQAGMGIHLASQFRHAASWEAEVYRGSASGGNCSGSRIANRTGNAGFLDWRTAPVSQGTAHCVKVRAINGPLSVSQAANVDAFAATVSSAGYTATINNSRGWDNIADLRPSQIVNQDDRTVNIGLPFKFIYFGTIYNRLVASTDGWMSMGGANIGVDTAPANFGSPGDPNNLIAPMFANLYCNRLMWKHLRGAPERFIISWDCRERANGSRVEFQTVFVRGRNHIIYRYRDVHFARFRGGGWVKQGMSSGNNSVNLNGRLLPAAVSSGAVVSMRNPRYEEELPRVSGVTAVLNHPQASMQVSGRSHVPGDMEIRIYRGGGGNACAGGAFHAAYRTNGRATSISHNFTRLTRGTTYCVRVQSENTAGTGVGAVVTPELQLIPRILRNDVRLAATANATQRRVQIETLPAGDGECTPVNGNIHQCGAGGRVYTFTAPEEGQYVFKLRASAAQAGPENAHFTFELDGQSIGRRELFSTSQSDFNELQVVANVTAGRHTFRARFDNDWCGGCGGNPDGLGRGDRNTVVDWYEVDGPYVKAGSTGTVTWSMQPNTTVGVVTQVAAPTTNNVIATDNAGQVRNTGTGNRVIRSNAITAGRPYFTRMTATNLAGQASTPWIERRFPAISGERVVSIDKANRTASLAFSVAPDAHASVQYRAAGTNRFTGCAGGNWQTLATGDSRGSHTARIANLNDNTYYCWRVVAEHSRGQPWRTVVQGPSRHFVFDRTAPRVTPPSYRVYEQDVQAGSRIAIARLGTPRVDDAVEGISLVATPFYCPRQVAQSCVAWDESAFRQKGTHYVRWRGVDAAGNEGFSAFQRFDVRDTTRPAYSGGPVKIVEAQSVAGTIVTLKNLTTNAPDANNFQATDACDARLDVTQETLVNGRYVSAATHRFARSTNPDGVGDHTVRVRVRDDSGNMTVGTYPVRIVDTTAPTFTLVPRAIVGLRDGCVTAYLPRPSVLDNSYPNNRLTLTKSHPDGPEDQGGTCWNEGGVMEGDIRVHTVRWTIADPQGNSRSTNMRVEVRRPTLTARVRVTSGGAEVEMGTYVRDDVSVQVTLLTRNQNCNEDPRTGQWDWIPIPTRVIQQPNQNLFTGIFAEDGNYIGGYVMVWHCDEFALIPDLSFGIDTIAPTHDFEKLINNAVDPDNVDTFLRQFVGNRLDLGGVTMNDERSGIQSITMILNPGDPGRPWGGEANLLRHTVRGRGVLITGSREVSGLDCVPGSEICVTANERPYLDMARLRTFDDDRTNQHRLRLQIRDFAGNVNTTDRYFLLRDYRSSLVDVKARVETMLEGAGGEDYEDDLNSTVTHLTESLGYWDARTRENAGPGFRDRQIAWSPSFSRAVNAANTLLLARRNDGPRVLSTFSKDIGSAMLGEMTMYVSTMEELRSESDLALEWWSNYISRANAQLASGRQSNIGSVQAARARDGYNLLAHLYELEYDLYSRVQETRQTAMSVFGNEDSDAEELDEARIGLTVAIQRFLQWVFREQLRTARDVSRVGYTQLQGAIEKMGNVTRCTDQLILQGLNDRQFTLCYLNIVEVVDYFREIQSALVDTTHWRTTLAHTVYAMLDVSLHYSLNALTTFDGDEEDELDYREDQMALTGIAEWRAGMEQLQSGDVDGALNRYMANRCRIVRLYNRYWYDEEDPLLAEIDEAEYCQ